MRTAAADLGVAPSHLSRLERGEKGGSSALAHRAAAYYGIDAAQLDPPAVPADITRILQAHPEALDELRARYGD